MAKTEKKSEFNPRRNLPPGPGPGRPKGVPNRTTGALRDAIIMAAEEHGLDGKGEDGLKGYLRHVASEDIKAFAGLLGKVLPMQVTGAEGERIGIEVTIVDPKDKA